MDLREELLKVYREHSISSVLDVPENSFDYSLCRYDRGRKFIIVGDVTEEDFYPILRDFVIRHVSRELDVVRLNMIANLNNVIKCENNFDNIELSDPVKFTKRLYSSVIVDNNDFEYEKPFISMLLDKSVVRTYCGFKVEFRDNLCFFRVWYDVLINGSNTNELPDNKVFII
jgi:hypothetical protein